LKHKKILSALVQLKYFCGLLNIVDVFHKKNDDKNLPSLVVVGWIIARIIVINKNSITSVLDRRARYHRPRYLYCRLVEKNKYIFITRFISTMAN